MKLQELFEMTMKAGNLAPSLEKFFQEFVKDIDQYTHVGDIEEIKVLLKDDIYLLVKEEPIAFFQARSINDGAEVLNAFVVEEYRKKGILSLFLFFLKRNEGYSKIYLGSVHSEESIETLKRLVDRFEIYWTNGSDKVKYDPSTINKFYGTLGKTTWSIVLENDNDFSDWPKYYTVKDIRSLYEGFMKDV